jgi:hypothetical protein
MGLRKPKTRINANKQEDISAIYWGDVGVPGWQLPVLTKMKWQQFLFIGSLFYKAISVSRLYSVGDK